MWLQKKLVMPTPETALPGRNQAIPVQAPHFVLQTSMEPPYPKTLQTAMFGLGCFWGAEKKFWSLQGIHTTAVGYSAGITANPTYEEVCSGLTGHNEVVLVVFDPAKIEYKSLLKTFWEAHNPTQGMRQGNDVGTQYRSGIYTFNSDQQRQAEESREIYQSLLSSKLAADITTEILPASPFYFAEDYHQQYLAKNPNGYCGLGGTGVVFCYNKSMPTEMPS
jgi:peptide-methionine (S)-S-oxide reductase